jgi:hypothetical protein
MYFWLYGKKSPNRQFRSALPACLVSLIRENYPSDTYTGFIKKLPSMKDKVLDMISLNKSCSDLKRRRKGGQGTQ